MQVDTGFLGFLQNDLSVLLTLAACLTINLWHVEKRPYFWARLAGAFLIVMGYCLVINKVIGPTPVPTKLWQTVAKYVGILALAIVGVHLCFRISWSGAMLYSASAFCVEHISQRGTGLLTTLFPGLSSYGRLVLCVVAILCIGLYFLFFFQRSADHREVSDRRIKIVEVSVCLLVVLTDIVFSFTFIYFAVSHSASVMLPWSNGASVLFSLLALIIARCHEDIVNRAYEIGALNRMQMEERKQYQRDQAAVDSLNQKAHDLKHRLSALRPQLNQQEWDELNQTVEAYDEVSRTGNAALDALLTAKAQLCRSQNIVFTRMVDGLAFSFLSEWEIYALFGNILDNAVNAASQVPDAAKRLISLTTSVTHGLLSIHEENYYAGELVFQGKLPVTSTNDPLNHGFGMKSIQQIVANYEGDLQIHIRDDVFSLDILLPLQEQRNSLAGTPGEAFPEDPPRA